MNHEDKSDEDKLMKPLNNYVAKHMRTYNKSTIEVDRKKAMKAGYTKHKKDMTNE